MNNGNGNVSERAKALSAFIEFLSQRGSHLPIGAEAHFGDGNCTQRDLTGNYVLMRNGGYVGRFGYSPSA